MSFVSTFLHTRPETSSWWESLPREQGEPASELGLDCRRLCHRADYSADYSASGGVANGTDVAERLRVTVRQPVSLLAHWIVDRHVIAFSCGGGLLLPLFQFDFARGCVRSGVAAALSELAWVMTQDEVARWFAQPNTWLKGAVPAQTLVIDVSAVLAAARADRFLAKG
jgi:hypothetical protein